MKSDENPFFVKFMRFFFVLFLFFGLFFLFLFFVFFFRKNGTHCDSQAFFFISEGF